MMRRSAAKLQVPPPHLGETTMRRWSMTIVLAVALLVPQYALTRNGRGHMMVAAVAYQKLSQATKDRVDAMLLLNPDRDNYTDRRSGTRADRTAFQQVFEDARLKKFDLVLFWALDRFSREGVTETLNYLKVLDSYGVAWKSFTESYLDSTGMFKEAVIAILAAVAKQEHARLSERVVAGLKRAKREGKALGRPKAIVDREKVREARAAGMSLRQIAAQLGISHTLVSSLLRA